MLCPAVLCEVSERKASDFRPPKLPPLSILIYRGSLGRFEWGFPLTQSGALRGPGVEGGAHCHRPRCFRVRCDLGTMRCTIANGAPLIAYRSRGSDPAAAFPTKDVYTIEKYTAARIMPIVHHTSPTFRPYAPAFALCMVSECAVSRAGNTIGYTPNTTLVSIPAK